MSYNVYQGEDLIAEKIEEKEYTVEGLTPDTDYDFSVTQVIGDKESEKASISVKTKAVSVTGVTLSPKTKTADSGTAGSEQLTAAIAPANATNKAVTYSIAPTTTGLTVSNSGKIDWTAAVASGTYTTTVKTTDGGKTDTHVLTLKDPVIAVTSVTIAPKTVTGESGTAGDAQLTGTVAPANATDKKVTYSVAPETEGLSINASGKLAWTDAVADGEYTITTKTADGNKTDTSVLTLSEPEPEPDPEEPEE